MASNAITPDRPRRKRTREQLPDTPDAVEIAMAAAATGKPIPDVARNVLEKHGGLIDAQIRELRLKHVVERLRVAVWGVLAFAGIAILLALGTLIWRAARSDSLAVEPFRVPPSLADAGLSGEVMATRVMDQIALMQARTLSTRPASSYSTDWGNDIKVEIPNTGATLGDLRRLLRSWLGQETRISGEAVREGTGWTVTARVTGQTAVSATGPELEPLVAQVAEGVFRQTQPYRYTVYLNGAGRAAEARAAARELALNGPEAERPWGLVGYANALGYPDYGDVEVLEALRKAAAAVPDFAMPVSNYATTLTNLGRWEEALRQHRRSAELVGDGSKISEQFRGQFVAQGNAPADLLTGAYAAAAERLEAAGRVGTPAYATGYVYSAISARYRAHDIAAGDHNHERFLELTGWTKREGVLNALNAASIDDVDRLMLVTSLVAQIERAQRLDDRAALARALPGQVVQLRALVAGFDAKQARDYARWAWPVIAPALARAGRAAEAEALLAPMPLDCYPCIVAHGEIAAAKGDGAAAQRWFERARGLGPSFPFADEAQGRMLLAAGDVDGAAAAFARAHRIEPRYADALKGWGDALLRQGDPKMAAKRYAEAAEHAPRWGALHLAWGDALRRDGDDKAARGKYRLAAGMGLSAADRARLAPLHR